MPFQHDLPVVVPLRGWSSGGDVGSVGRPLAQVGEPFQGSGGGGGFGEDGHIACSNL